MLNVSIVTYCPDWQGEVLPLVEELQKVQALHRVYIVDNSPEPFAIRVSDRVQYIHTGQNLGYGKAHNIAIVQAARWDSILSSMIEKGKDYGLSEEFITAFFTAIHDASVAEQNRILER